MSSDSLNYFTKENLDTYLKELAKEYRKLGGKTMPAEIILIGGAAIIASYRFREMTTDVDAVIHAASSMKDAINIVGDRLKLPNGWLNTDFMRTVSYSPKIDEYSTYYKNFYNVLNIRTISAEYLIAMKLRSGRKYKNDLSDIIGILAEHEKHGVPITFDSITTAVTNLYDSWDNIPADSRIFIEHTMSSKNLAEIYEKLRSEEKRSAEMLISFEQNYPGVANTENIDNILTNLRAKTPNIND